MCIYMLNIKNVPHEISKNYKALTQKKDRENWEVEQIK